MPRPSFLAGFLRTRGLLLTVLTCLSVFRAAALDGAIDPSFQAPFLGPIPSLLLLEPDGHIIVNYGSAGGTVGLTRLSTNGAADPGFNTGLGPLIITPPFDIPGTGIHLPGATNPGSIASIALQSGGRVIVGGNFTYFNSTTVTRSYAVRLKPDGSVDPAFTVGNGLTGSGTSVLAVAVDDNDRIYLGGKFGKANGIARATALIRLKPDGSVDDTFADVTLAGLGSAVIQSIAFQPDHKIVVTASYFSASFQPTTAVHRLLPDGGLDPDFQQGPGTPSAAGGVLPAVLPNGQILVTLPPSATLTYNGVAITGSLFRLNANGSVDSQYPNPLLKLFNTGLSALHVVPVPDGRVYISGGFDKVGSVAQAGLARLLSDGSVDLNFSPPPAFAISGFALAVQPDGKVLAQYNVIEVGVPRYGILRLLSGSPSVPKPVIDTPLLNQTVATGARASFTVVATGTGLTYRWRHGDSDVSGATEATLVIDPATAEKAGDYTVIVTNEGGSTPSGPVQLIVLDPPKIGVAPLARTIIAGSKVSFVVVASGGPVLKYQWYKDDQPIDNATTDVYEILSPAAGNQGKYSVKVSNAVGFDTSVPVDLVVLDPPLILPQPISQSVVLPPDLTGPCDGLTTSTLPGHTLSMTINSALPPFAASGSYQIVLAPQGATYSIAASGATPAAAGAWSFGPDLGVNTVLTLGHYFANGSAAKVALLPDCTYELYADGLATSQGGTFSVGPVIVRQPVSVKFVAGATGTGPFTFEWRHEGKPIPGAHGSEYTVPDVHPADLGKYTVLVTGPGGSVESDPAFLTEAAVVTQPTLTFQVSGGTTLRFTIPAGFRLERTASLLKPQWSEVPGSGTIDVPIVGNYAFFRLVQP